MPNSPYSPSRIPMNNRNTHKRNPDFRRAPLSGMNPASPRRDGLNYALAPRMSNYGSPGRRNPVMLSPSGTPAKRAPVYRVPSTSRF
jgi:hypothetical protein